MKKFIICLLILSGMLFAVEPQRVILNVTETPESSVAVTFRFYEKVDTAYVHFSKNTSDVKLHAHADTLKLYRQIAYTDTTNTVAHYTFSGYMSGLEPATEYAYRVGDGKDWTPWYTFTTASTEKYNFTMVYLGDPQWGYTTYLPRIYSAAIKEAPHAALWYVAGDLVDYPFQDWQWDEYFKGAIPSFTQYPQVMCVGNHAYLWAYAVHKDTLPATWRPHLTQPENGPEGLEETCFYIDFQGVRIIMLNGNERLEEQAEWLKKVLKKNRNRWTIVGIHQGFYPCGWERDYPENRELFLPLFEKYGVQLVLQGHDHAYTRTYPLKEDKIVESSKGVSYIISVAGSKQYPIKSKFDDLYAHKGKEGQQYFQTIDVTKDSLVYKSFLANGTCQDKLVIKR